MLAFLRARPPAWTAWLAGCLPACPLACPSVCTCLSAFLSCRHRGTGVRPNERRLTQHIIIRRARAEWVQSDCWVPRFASGAVDPAFIGGLSPWQRSTLGMPPPGDCRWDLPTLAATAARYSGFDALPYSAVATVCRDCSRATKTTLDSFSDDEAQGWHTRGWVALKAESIWPADMLAAATQVAEVTPIPDYEPGQQRLRPNGAMGGPALVDTPPFTIEGDATVQSLGELPFDHSIDTLAFAPSAVSIVAEMMECTAEDVRLCRSELVAVVPAPPLVCDENPDSAGQGSCSVSLWQPHQYNLLASEWDGQRRTDAVACLFVHNTLSPLIPSSVDGAAVETNAVSQKMIGSSNGHGIAALYDVTQPHTLRIPYGRGEPLLCSILLWRRKDADWIGWEAWGKKLSGYANLSSPTMGSLERGLLGWPAVGSDYWQDAEAFDGAAERYGHDVMIPYRARI